MSTVQMGSKATASGPWITGSNVNRIHRLVRCLVDPGGTRQALVVVIRLRFV